MTASWVIGRGLLGGAIVAASRDSGARRDVYRADVRWGDLGEAGDDLRAGLAAFIATVGTDEPWSVLWTAGAGVTATPQDVLDVETATLAAFLTDLAALPPAVRDRGVLFLASSVGGVYGGNPAPPFTEYDEVHPISDYGRAKAAAESQATELAASGIRVLIGRITNLYGPGQNLDKGQGLISTIARTYLTGQPATVYVSLDTIRDYLFVDDGARVVLAAVDRLHGLPAGTVVTKIIGSALGSSIGALIGEFSRQRRRRPLIVLAGSGGAGQAPDLRVKSVVWTDLDGLASTTLAAGVARTYAWLFAANARGPEAERHPAGLK